jgi:hemerythrin HHE cation binding domain-containing protein
VNFCPALRSLVAEHARWRAALGGGGRAAAASPARLLALWEEEVLPRCRREEEVLLPELSRRLSEADAVVVFTLADHVALRRLARELRAAGPGERRAIATRLAGKLEEHASFEERTLFPALQEALGCDRLAALRDELGNREAGPADRPPATNSPARTNRKGTKP